MGGEYEHIYSIDMKARFVELCLLVSWLVGWLILFHHTKFSIKESIIYCDSGKDILPGKTEIHFSQLNQPNGDSYTYSYMLEYTFAIMPLFATTVDLKLIYRDVIVL